MWGYIGLNNHFDKQSGVPSLYVRVYRPDNWLCISDKGSLIICEGISARRNWKWTYIEVPSLYVRVYRGHNGYTWCRLCSLIICEGISPRFFRLVRCVSFPHYMWGYIDNYALYIQAKTVPSLYVRVYHIMPHTHTRGSSSLIICEGISFFTP